MRLLLSVSLLLAVLVVTGCEQTQEERARDRAERVSEDVEREIERTQQRLEELQDRLDDMSEGQRENTERVREDVSRAVEASMEELGRALERVGEGLQESSDVDPVDWRDMKAMLPDEVEGFRRLDWEGHNKRAIGIRMSTIKAEYERGQDALNIAVVDLGSISGLARAGYDWLDAEIDSATRDGYKRTREIEGYPGFIEVDRGGSRHEMVAVVIVEDRFVVAVEANGENLDDDLVLDVMDELPLRRLRRMVD